MLRRSVLFLVFALFYGIPVLTAANDWTPPPAELVSPAQLNAELAAVKSGKIVLIHVGFSRMYQMAHIPGSHYTGAGSREEGVVGLRKLVAGLPRRQHIVIYCGCCPWKDCPNIQPAFKILKEMGFTSVKSLDIPNRLGDDWTAKGYPIAKGE